MPILQKINLSNFIVDQSKRFPDVVTPESRFIDTLFVNVIKEQCSLYFYKCTDILHVMHLLSKVRFIRQQAEFWYKIEDLLLRMKRDFKVTQIVQIVELYSQMERGSQLFWGELEDYLMINSSEFRLLDKKFIQRVIIAFNKVGRTNETFWKVFSQLYEEQQNAYSFEDRIALMNVFADHASFMTMHLYKQFESAYLPQPTQSLKDFKMNFTQEQQVKLINILDKYQGIISSQVIKDL